MQGPGAFGTGGHAGNGRDFAVGCQERRQHLASGADNHQHSILPKEHPAYLQLICQDPTSGLWSIKGDAQCWNEIHKQSKKIMGSRYLMFTAMVACGFLVTGLGHTLYCSFRFGRRCGWRSSYSRIYQPLLDTTTYYYVVLV